MWWFFKIRQNDHTFDQITDAMRWGGYDVFRVFVAHIAIQFILYSVFYSLFTYAANWDWKGENLVSYELYHHFASLGWIPQIGFNSLALGVLVHGFSAILNLLFIFWIVGSSSRSPMYSIGLWKVPNIKSCFGILLLMLAFIPPCFFLKAVWGYAIESIGLSAENQAPVQMFMQTVQSGDVVGILSLILIAVFVAPVIEEFIFRGIIHGYLVKQLGSSWVAPTVSASIFAAIHLNWAALLPIFVLGYILARLYERRGSLYDAILLHMYFNAFSLLLLFIILQFPPEELLKELGSQPSAGNP